MNQKNTQSKILTEEQIKQSASYLTHSFKDATEGYRLRTGDNKNTKGTFLYEQQIEFAHIMNEIQRGPIFFAIQNIATANDIINIVKSKTKS